MKLVLPLDVTNYNIERSRIISIFTYKLTKLSRKFCTPWRLSTIWRPYLQRIKLLKCIHWVRNKVNTHLCLKLVF